MSATEDKQELAEERTDWAEDRTLLANERTFGGWLRTGLAAVGVGLGFQAIFRSFEPTWMAKAAASIFILIGITIFIFALQTAKAMLDRLQAHTAEPVSSTRITVIAVLFMLGSFCLGVLLWML